MGRGKVLLVVLVVLLVAFGTSTYLLRGAFAPTREFAAYGFAESQLKPYSYETVGNISLPATGFQSVQTAQGHDVTVNGSTIAGDFIGGGIPAAVTFQQNLSADIQRYPFFHATIESTPNYSATGGFAFGFRFLAELNGGRVALLQNDSFPVEHVKSGGVQDLTINIQNYGFNVTKLLAVRLYMEERPGISSSYSLTVSSMFVSSVTKVPFCSSGLCFVPLAMNETSGYLDALVADINYAGDHPYQLGFSNQNQLFLSRPYGNGTSYVSISSASAREPLVSVPSLPNTLYIVTNAGRESVTFEDAKVTFTATPTSTSGVGVQDWTSLALVFGELSALIFVPALLLASGARWRILLGAGIALRVFLMPWTGHPSDTVLLIRTAYLYYHEGWSPLFYNPPTIVALSIPTAFMQFYYLLGLDKIDQTFLFHFGGVIASFFAKLPFLVLDMVNAFVLTRVSQRKEIGLGFFLNPFSIYVSAVWGQYESVTVFFLLAGYLIAARAKNRLGYFASIGGFVFAGLVELFGFLVTPLILVFLAIRRQFLALALTTSAIVLFLAVPTSLSRYVLSFGLSNPILQPDIYSVSSALRLSSQFPFIVAFGASMVYALYALLRTRDIISTIPGIAAAVVSFELFAGNHPQLMLLPLGLVFLFFLSSHDDEGTHLVWFLGAVVTVITIAGTQSFAYLLTGEGYDIFPAIEGGNHLAFYSIGLLVASVTLLLRTRRQFSLIKTGAAVSLLMPIVWYVVNYLWI